MTLDKYRSLADRALEPFVTAAARLGLTPNGVSVLAIVVAGLAAGAFYLGGDEPLLYGVGALLVFVNGWLDLLDGALARRLEVASEAGDLLDHVLDRYADILIIAGLAAGIGRYDLGLAAVTGVLMTSYLGTQAQAVGLDRVYGGLLGRADRLALIGVVGALAVVVTDPIQGFTIVGWLLIVFAVVGHLTALQRFYYAMGDLR
ncbi:CDP-alcohol phosphatidyltransferase family protein [Halapricum hydrolyticum]|uniref:CDP-alcohol phosphatidyltransferase family protein n=1 Tax=Halapricum hydrolyticum TaxID=2979991 RepID=A0AAE3IBX3_9EURY|nr:CDP-alcohol phosphatidyltransferase family protein [Halapricum hydrolyticum]MCU4716691.1 CDP-alcohol phosphatidyltransferase family protein [Halapricum hydrolyticum]MCU4725704.1 CDP-alcohol phosphatidyltransferase family protein [Halapricum hydrolyticum]